MATTPQTATQPSSQATQRPAGEGPPTSLDALHAHGRVRRGARDPDPRQGGRLLRLGRARQPLPRRPLGAVLRERRPRPRRARRGGQAPDRRARLLHQLELRPPGRDRARGQDREPRARRPQPRLLHLRRLRGRGVRLEAGPRLPQAQRRGPAHEGRSRARPPTTAPPSARSRSPASPRCARSSSRSCRATATCRTRTPTAGPRTATRSGRPSRSLAPDRVRGTGDDRRRVSWSRCRTPAAASCRRTATSSACARSATSTASCSSPTRSSAPGAGSATSSAASASATSRTSSRPPRGSPRPTRRWAP